MKRFAYFLFFWTILSSCSNPRNKTDQTVKADSIRNDFYGLQWSMNREQVKSILGKNYEESDGNLYYQNREVSNLKCLVFCKFINDSLSLGTFNFLNTTMTTPEKYIDEFERLKNILIEKYNKPILDTIICSNTHYLKNKNEWGVAAIIGVLKLRVEWKTERSYIVLNLANMASTNQAKIILAYLDLTKLSTLKREGESKQKNGL